MNKFITRLKFHSFRFKTELITGTAIVVLMNTIMSLGIPDDTDYMANYADIIEGIGLDAVLVSFDANAPGFLFWNSLMLGLYVYFTVAIIGIRIGSRLFPTKENDTLELSAASSPQPARKLYIETYLSGMLLLLIVIFSSFLAIAISGIILGSADVLGRFAITHLFLFAVGLFFLSLASCTAVLRFNKGSGDKVGYLYLVFAFFLEIGSSGPDVPEEVSYLSVNRYVKPTAGLLTNEWDWNPFFMVLVICGILLTITYWRIKFTDYIERFKPEKASRFDFIPSFSYKGKFAQRNPILFDQLRTDRNLFVIWTAVLSFFLVYMVALYKTMWANDNESFEEILRSFDIPMLKAFTHGNETRYDFMGFLGFEYYGIFWAYYGLFLLIPSIGAANRDYRNNENDVLWSGTITPKQVMKTRSLAILILFYAMFTITSLTLIGLEVIFGITGDIVRQLYVYFVGLIFFTGLLLLLQGITMLLPISKGRNYALWFYMASIIVMITGFMVEPISFIKYFAFTYYFNTVGLLFGTITLGEGVLLTSIFTIMSGAIYYYGLDKFHSSNLS